MSETVFSCLSRRIFTGTVVPGLVATTVATSSSRFFTGLPLNSRMTSPGSMPAFAAGLPRETVPTSAPRRSFNPNSASASAGTGDTLTPITPRDTRPVCSCGISSRTLLIGIAKPMPMLPCWRESV